MITVHGHRGLFLINVHLKDLLNHEATISYLDCREDQVYLYGRAYPELLSLTIQGFVLWLKQVIAKAYQKIKLRSTQIKYGTMGYDC